MAIAVTGASGFVGRALVAELGRQDLAPRAIDRATLLDPERLATALAGCETVIHLAALAHRQGRNAASEAEHTAINRDLAIDTARVARAAGVTRFIFVSSIAVLAGGPRDAPLATEMSPAPRGAYGRAKAAAEATLAQTADIEVVIVRPPLVYAANAPGNLAALERLAALPIPLPFGAVHNQRDMVGRSNLVDALAFLTRAGSDTVAGRIFHVTDGAPLSLAQIVSLMRERAGRGSRLIPVPPALMRPVIARLRGAEMASQLLDDLRVEGSALRAAGWQPPFAAGHDFRADAGRVERTRNAR